MFPSSRLPGTMLQRGLRCALVRRTPRPLVVQGGSKAHRFFGFYFLGLDSEVSPRTKTPIKKVQLQFVHPGQRIKVGPFSQPQARRTSRSEYLVPVASITTAAGHELCWCWCWCWWCRTKKREKRNNLDCDHRDAVIAELMTCSSSDARYQVLTATRAPRLWL